VGIYANDAREAVYPFLKTDSEGRPIDGAKYSYTITFDSDDLPPAKAFWSISAYDAKTQLFVKNQAGRNLVNSSMIGGMKKDGKNIVIRISASPPGKELENNWLPIPEGLSFLVMRLYWPNTKGSSILPPGRGSWKPPPVVRMERNT
jgi:hypothetical protein